MAELCNVFSGTQTRFEEASHGGQKHHDDLSARRELPDEFSYLAREYPRAEWEPDALDATAKDWLFKHDWFRVTQRSLLHVGEEWREGVGEPRDYSQLVIPTLRHFLASLDYHQTVENEHYFPAMASTESGMRHGFELLQRDHAEIRVLLVDVGDAADMLTSGIAAGGVGKAEAARLTIAIENASTPVRQHLWDEEEIVIPLLTLRGDPFATAASCSASRADRKRRLLATRKRHWHDT